MVPEDLLAKYPDNHWKLANSTREACLTCIFLGFIAFKRNE